MVLLAWVKDEPTVGRRRGVSLLEVLISMFVITLGLLGLAALIPVGKTDVSAATRADRASALGRAAYRDMKIRGLLKPEMWCSPTLHTTAANLWFDVDEVRFDEADLMLTLPDLNPLVGGNSLCLDPLFVARAQSEGLMATHNWRGRAFPYPLDNDPTLTLNNDPASRLKPPRMARASVRAWPRPSLGNPTLALESVAAERIFRATDDLLFQSLDVDPSGRPMLQHDLSGGNPVRPQYAGDYSWLVTITPAADWRTWTSGASVSDYTVSVVVFFKRPMVVPPPNATDPEPLAERLGTRPTERVVLADFINGIGLGGGDVRLRLPVADSADNYTPGAPDSSDMPRVRAGQWIMLSGWVMSPTPLPVAGNPQPFWAVYRWYRVVAAESEVRLVEDSEFPNADAEWVQDVTLSGADWWPVGEDFFQIFIDADNTPPGSTPTVYASLFEGVASVYEKTVQLDTTAGR